MQTILTNSNILLPYGVSKQVNAAQEALRSGVQLLAFGGKQGAGKDTIAPLVLAGLGVEAPYHSFFAQPLKKEVNDVIRILQEALTGSGTLLSDAQAGDAISAEMGVPFHHALIMVDTLADEVKSGAVTSSYQRTPSVRKALQFWGTDVRRAQSETYWVGKTLQAIIDKLSEGTSVFLTDMRFTNEADAILHAGGKAIRLDISPDVQYDRIMKRDGIAISSDSREHVSETALDDYPHFFTRVNVDTALPGEVAVKILERIASDG